MNIKYIHIVLIGLVLHQGSCYSLFRSSKSSVDQSNKVDIEKKLSETLLNNILANESVLLFQTLNYHWNLVGVEFHDYHLLFDEQYKQLFDNIDKIAERVRAIGGFALGSMQQMIGFASLKEDQTIPKPKKMIKKLLNQYEMLIEQISLAIMKIEEKNNDVGTVNFLQELITQHEKTAWMLRSLSSKK